MLSGLESKSGQSWTLFLLQIDTPDEFDMMLKLLVPSRFNTTTLDAGLFYRIDLTRPTRNPIKDFLLDDRLTLSSSKILTEMFRLVRKFLKTYRGLWFSPTLSL